MIVERT